MIDKKNFAEVKKAVDDYDSQREKIIIQSRTVLKLSKQLIYSVHRDDLGEAKKLKGSIEKELKDLLALAKTPKQLNEGSIRIAVQEHVEAVAYYDFVTSGKITKHSGDFLTETNYLLGLCDLTGELTRRAVNKAAKGKYKDVLQLKEGVDEIYGAFLSLDIRENELRKKVDSIKYDLKKLEELVADLKLKDKI